MVKKMKIIINLIWFLFFPALIILGTIIKEYRIISVVAMILAIIPFFLKFESRSPEANEVVLIAVLTALVVMMRVVFSPFPFFKPVTALIILTALVFGKETGFLVGALAALLSNFYFGQGVWTPFQMFAWGFVGYFSGLFKNIDTLKLKFYLLLVFLGVFGGLAFSLIMDFQTVLFIDNRFNLTRFYAAILASSYFTGIHILSNIFFLLVFGEIIYRIFVRIKIKYY